MSVKDADFSKADMNIHNERIFIFNTVQDVSKFDGAGRSIEIWSTPNMLVLVCFLNFLSFLVILSHTMINKPFMYVLYTKLMY